MSIVRGGLHGHPRAASLDAARTQSWTDGQTDKDNTKQKVRHIKDKTKQKVKHTIYNPYKVRLTKITPSRKSDK